MKWKRCDPRRKNDNEIEPCLRCKSNTKLFIVSIFYLTQIPCSDELKESSGRTTITNCKLFPDIVAHPLEPLARVSQCLLFEFACFLLISILYAHIYIYIYIYLEIVKLQIIKNRQISRYK